MYIEAMQKLTLLDFPGRTAAILFTHGCNFRCPFCHNAGLVIRPSEARVDEEEIFAFLHKRKGLLDGVCITGGEPLMQPDIADFIRRVREIGYAVKLDTNGSLPNKLAALLEDGLLDYVAMDIKNSPEKYALTVGVGEAVLDKVRESVSLLMSGNTDFEFRTTVTGNLHTPQDISEIGAWIAGAPRYFLQSFKDSGDLVGTGCTAPDKEALEKMLSAARVFVPATEVRG